MLSRSISTPVGKFSRSVKINPPIKRGITPISVKVQVHPTKGTVKVISNGAIKDAVVTARDPTEEDAVALSRVG